MARPLGGPVDRAPAGVNNGDMEGFSPSESAKPRQTPLTGWHVAHGARMVDFAGNMMPIQYSSILTEHHAVRKSAGMFDVSHMGRLLFRGNSALDWLDRLLTCRLRDMAEGQARYSLVCSEAGGVIDDVLVTRWADAWGLVVNASNHAAMLDWLGAHRPSGASLEDITQATAMMAVQGPDWREACPAFIGSIVDGLGNYRGRMLELGGLVWRVSRTGYTGEEGIEIVAPAQSATSLADSLLAAGVAPCGLGARDTLRLEAGMPLYGHELDSATDPFQAGLGRSVDMKKEFVGKKALVSRMGDTTFPVRVGIQLEGRRAARQGDAVLDKSGKPIGKVTSGAFSPTLGHPVAMAYLDRRHARPGEDVSLSVRESMLEGTVCPLPFYKREQRG